MIKKPFLWLISLYRIALSPVLPPSCRFYPSCSAYAHQAIEVHGAAQGVFYAVKRLLRCHPYSDGGFDPVPDARGEKCADVLHLHETGSGAAE